MSEWYPLGLADNAISVRRSLGLHVNGTAFVYFPLYLADPMHGYEALARLGDVLQSLSCGGVHAALLLGRPEYWGAGTAAHSRDVVHNATHRQYMLDAVKTVLSHEGVYPFVGLVSVYWLGAASFCVSGGCSSDDILSLNEVCARVCARVCVRECVRACVRACVRVCAVCVLCVLCVLCVCCGCAGGVLCLCSRRVPSHVVVSLRAACWHVL
jgi:hypothetical protein